MTRIISSPAPARSGPRRTTTACASWKRCRWIRTRPVHAADFFHGTLELVEQGVSVFVFKGEDASRPLSERGENFAKRYSDRVRVLDAARSSFPESRPRCVA